MAIQNDPVTSFFSSLGQPTATVGNASGDVASSFFSNIQTTQPKTVATAVTQPIVTPKKTTITDITTFIKQSPFQVIKNALDFKKIGQSFVAGAKVLPSQVKQAGGIILQSAIKQKELTDQFLKPVKKIVGITTSEYQVDKTIATKAKELATGLRETGFVGQKKATEEYAKTYQPSENFSKYIEMAAFNLPQVAASTGLSLATSLITKNPALGTALGLGTSYGLGASEVYNEARTQGVSDKQALPIAVAGGVIIGALDFLPLERLLKNSASVKTIKKSIIKNIATGLASAGIQSGFEGITEMAQEIVGNAISLTYNEHQDLFEGAKEAGIVGALLGGVTNVTLDTVTGVTSKKGGSIEKKVEEALSTPKEERTEEQKQIVEAVTTQELSPDEAASYVINNDIGKTEEGKAIMLAANQAKQEGKIIRIIPSEDEKSMEITISDPTPLPSFTEQEEKPVLASKEEVKPIVEESRGEKIEEEQIKELSPAQQEWIKKNPNVTNEDGSVFIPKTVEQLAKEYKSAEDFVMAMKSMTHPLEIIKEYTSNKKITTAEEMADALRKTWEQSAKAPIEGISKVGEIAQKRIDELKAKQGKTTEKEEVAKKPEEKKTEIPKEQPKGEGRIKESRFFNRVKEQLGVDYENENRKYNELSLDDQAEKVVQLIKDDPEKAVQIAQGVIDPPSGMTQNAVALGLAEVAYAKNDMQTVADLWSDTSLRSTRLGQEIVSLRGAFNADSPLNAVKKIMSLRMEQVIKKYDAVIKQLKISPEATMAQKYDALVKDQKTKAKKQLTETERRLASAQEIINKLKCK